MARRSSSAVLRQIQTLFSAGTFSGQSDRQLLERFAARRDAVSELAFAVLVERHGPMVLSVCRRILIDPHDAEDAFQATFLVMVRKAALIRVEGSLGRWLYGVATRVAARARANARRRRGRERSGLDRLETAARQSATTAIEVADLRSILDEELGNLPARFQAPVVLCDLEGSSHEEAARLLGWPVGTVKSRLSRARARLRGRLIRRGLAPADLSIVAPLLPAPLPQALVAATCQAASSLIAAPSSSAEIIPASVVALTEGVLRTMFLTKIKLAATALLVIMAGSAIVVSQATAQKPVDRTAKVDDLAAPTTGAGQAARHDDELEVVMLERAWADAIPRRDAAVVNRILADDFEGIDPVGNIFTKATYIPDLRRGVFAADPIQLDEIKARILGETAVATSRVKIKTAATYGRMTNVYSKQQGRWQCVASHMCWIAPATSVNRLTEDQYRDMFSNAPRADVRWEAEVTALIKEVYQNELKARDKALTTDKAGVQPGQQGGAGQAQGQPGKPEGQSGKTAAQMQSQMTSKMGTSPVPAAEPVQGQSGKSGAQNGMASQMQSQMASMKGTSPAHAAEPAQGQSGKSGAQSGAMASPMQSQMGQMASMMKVRSAARQLAEHALIPVRPRFECLVERVQVKPGQTVRKGEPLVELFSTDLAAAKNDYLTAEVQWKQDQRLLGMRRELVERKAISQQLWVDSQNLEEKSRLAFQIARDRLKVLGLGDAAIGRVGTEDGEQKARLTLTSPVDGVVVEVDAEPGGLYDRKGGLMVIRSTTPQSPAKP